MSSSRSADGVGSKNPGTAVELEGMAEEAMDRVDDIPENVTARNSGKDGGLSAVSSANDTKTIPENGGSSSPEFVSSPAVGHDSDMEVEVGSEEGDDILCDVCKIWRRSHQWKEHLASRCHQRNSRARRREQQWQNEQGRVRGELLEVEDRIARLNLEETGN